MPASHHSMFTGQMLFLTPNQQYKSTEDNRMLICWFVNTSFKLQGCGHAHEIVASVIQVLMFQF